MALAAADMPIPPNGALSFMLLVGVLPRWRAGISRCGVDGGREPQWRAGPCSGAALLVAIAAMEGGDPGGPADQLVRAAMEGGD